jgi:hypothetical protein
MRENFFYRMPPGAGRLFPRRRIHPPSLAKFKLNDPAVEQRGVPYSVRARVFVLAEEHSTGLLREIKSTERQLSIPS